MRRLAIALVFCAAAAGAPDTPGFLQDLERFNAAFNSFFRSYFGCPRDARQLEQCRPAAGYVDMRAYKTAAKYAAKVFPQ